MSSFLTSRTSFLNVICIEKQKSLGHFPFSIIPLVPDPDGLSKVVPEGAIYLELRKSPLLVLPQGVNFKVVFDFRNPSGQADLMHFFKDDFLGVIDLRMIETKLQILILHKDPNSDDVVALLPANQELVASIFYNKSYRPFVKMAKMENDKLMQIVTKICQNHFSTPFKETFKSDEGDTIKNLLEVKAHLESGWYLNSAVFIQDLITLFQSRNGNFSMTKDDFSLLGGMLMKTLKDLLVDNAIPFDEKLFEPRSRFDSNDLENQKPIEKKFVGTSMSKKSKFFITDGLRRKGCVTKQTRFSRIQEIKKRIIKEYIDINTYKAVLSLGVYIQKSLKRNPLLSLKPLIRHDFLGILMRFKANSIKSKCVATKLGDCVDQFIYILEHFELSNFDMSPADVESILTELKTEIRNVKSIEKHIFTGHPLYEELVALCPNHPKDYIFGISETHAIDKTNPNSKEFLFDNVLTSKATLPPIDSNGNFSFVRYHLFPSFVFDENNFLDAIFRLAESAFLRMANLSPSQAMERRIFCIDYIKNVNLEKVFEATKKSFQSSGIPAGEKLMFHGTHVDNLDKILAFNFDPVANPVSRKKRQMFGQGIYFSEYPHVSINYGTLILCRTIPGKVEDVGKVSGTSLEDTIIPDGFQSRCVSELVFGRVSSLIHIIKTSNQVLPFCVIRLFNSKASAQANPTLMTNSSMSMQSRVMQVMRNPAQVQILLSRANSFFGQASGSTGNVTVTSQIIRNPFIGPAQQNTSEQNTQNQPQSQTSKTNGQQKASNPLQGLSSGLPPQTTSQGQSSGLPSQGTNPLQGQSSGPPQKIYNPIKGQTSGLLQQTTSQGESSGMPPQALKPFQSSGLPPKTLQGLTSGPLTENTKQSQGQSSQPRILRVRPPSIPVGSKECAANLCREQQSNAKTLQGQSSGSAQPASDPSQGSSAAMRQDTTKASEGSSNSNGGQTLVQQSTDNLVPPASRAFRVAVIDLKNLKLTLRRNLVTSSSLSASKRNKTQAISSSSSDSSTSSDSSD